MILLQQAIDIISDYHPTMINPCEYDNALLKRDLILKLLQSMYRVESKNG